jgi:hypothetical protein
MVLYKFRHLVRSPRVFWYIIFKDEDVFDIWMDSHRISQLLQDGLIGHILGCYWLIPIAISSLLEHFKVKQLAEILYQSRVHHAL